MRRAVDRGRGRVGCSTGWINGGKRWLHVGCTQMLTALHESRGGVAVDDFAVLTGYAGIVVHDALSVYDGEKNQAATHALCGAHIARELVAHTAREQGMRQIPPEIAEPLLDSWRHAILCGPGHPLPARWPPTIQDSQPARTPPRP